MDNYRHIFVILSSMLHTEIIYIHQLLRDTPIGRLVAHQNMVINLFIIVCTKYDSCILQTLDAIIQYGPHLQSLCSDTHV